MRKGGRTCPGTVGRNFKIIELGRSRQYDFVSIVAKKMATIPPKSKSCRFPVPRASPVAIMVEAFQSSPLPLEIAKTTYNKRVEIK